MKTLISTIFIAIAVSGHGQALREINYNYLYDPDAKFSFDLRPARVNDSWIIAYCLTSHDTAIRPDQLTIVWEGRDGLGEKESFPLNAVDERGRIQSGSQICAFLDIPASQAPKILAAKIVDQAQKRAWYFFTVLEENYPVNNQLVSQGQPLVKSFVHPSASLEFAEKNNRWIVSYYNDNFPAAAPAFSEGQARVAKTMKPDSVYMLNGSDRFAMQKKGLYLFQTDTMKVAGFSMRVESDYPKFTKFQNLPGPLIYICTKQEYDRLELSADKKAFDRTVLSITADTERAKKLMRSYFRRVEFANEYFTSYKEGWKTDRGMIYIIFGVPDEVYRFNDREVWHYQDGKLEQTFDFVKSPTLFDPDNYVLIRNKKFREQWYEIIDLWRNARF